MKSYDFEYDGIRLSDMGFMICNFSSKGLETISNGSQITFNTISILNGSKNEITSVEYDGCLETTFQICKKVCDFKSDKFEVTQEEQRKISRWLNRKQFYKFKLLEDEHINIYYEGSFNISKIENDGKIVGFELNLITNRPFALFEKRKINIENTTVNGKYCLFDISDEEGYIYPDVKITINQSGNLSITNSIDDRMTYIKGCKSGEVITFKYPIIESSDVLHSKTIMNDFNWNFIRISNKFDNIKNEFTISLPCKIEMSYSPIAKVGL